MVQQFEDITKIKTELKIGQIPFQIPSKIEYMLYRIIQESLTNAFRHGRPTLIEILIRMEGSAIKVSVRDNGQGTLRKGTGIGITGMEERIHELDGKLFLNKTANGTQLDIHIPVFFTAM
jgi:signal transduction histidine kinase